MGWKSKKLRILIASLTFAIASVPLNAFSAHAKYWLVIGSYRQGPGGRPEVSGITSPSIYAIPMKTLELCEAAGERIEDEIYKPVWQFDQRWTCIYDGE